MANRHDVVIAGAGPAGAQCARDVASMGYDVVVLEAEAEAEFPGASNKSTGGTFPAMLQAFEIPEAVLMHRTDRVVLESPNHHVVEDKRGAVLDFGAFKEFLVADSRQQGAEYWFDCRATAPITDDTGHCIGMRYDGDNDVYADIVIDATGPAAPLATELGVSSLERDTQAIGVEYEFENLDLDPSADERADARDAMVLHLNHEYAPGGYAWLFHTGGDTAKVGVCYIQTEAARTRGHDEFTIDDYLDRWLEADPRLAGAERRTAEHHRGSAHVGPPGDLCTDGFMAIGDTVPTIDPLWGEGIHKCMQSARNAAIVVDQALAPAKPDTTTETLSAYRDLWHDEVAPNVRARLVLNRLLYMADNDRYDRLLRDLDDLSTDALSSLGNRDPRTLLRLVRLSDLWRLPRALWDLQELTGNRRSAADRDTFFRLP